MLRLIGIDGNKGAGKDTLADALITRLGFKRLAFAQPLKDMLAEVFILPPITFEDRALKDAPFNVPLTLSSYHIQRILDYLELSGIKVSDTSIKAALTLSGTVFHTPREMMQLVGTELVREKVGKDTWVTLWCKEQAKYDKVVAPDARMPNERAAIAERLGKNVLVKRPDLDQTDAHASENNHGADNDYDAIATNSGGKHKLQSEFLMWYTVVCDKGFCK